MQAEIPPGPFQSTPPHGERPLLVLFLVDHTNFNPRPRMGSDLVTIFLESAEFRDFNPRPRMGSDMKTLG